MSTLHSQKNHSLSDRQRCSINCQSKLLTNSSAFSRRLNVVSDGADGTCALKLFHVRAAATVNERSPDIVKLT